MNPTDIAFTISTIVLAVVLYFAFRSYFRRQEEERLQDLRNAIENAARHGMIEGMNHAFIAAAAVYPIPNVHGFAEACRRCGAIAAIMTDPRAEYWSCRECNHRNPAPLPTRLNLTAKHDDA